MLKRLLTFILVVCLTGCTTSPVTTEYPDIPEWDGKTYHVVLNNNKTYFDQDYDLNYYHLSKLDALKRVQSAMIVVSPDTFAKDERESISHIKPTGFNNEKYMDIVKDGYCYQRSHLLMYAMCDGRFDTNVKRNLMTGTAFFNANETHGMLHYERIVYNYCIKTKRHVLYRVTPVYHKNELVARGVIMEAKSLEDHGKSLEYCVFIYNVQPKDINGIDENDYNGTDLGISINYATGKTHPMTLDEFNKLSDSTTIESTDEVEVTYVLNIHTHKIHLPDCKSVMDMKIENKKETNETLETLMNEGYVPCGSCLKED